MSKFFSRPLDSQPQELCGLNPVWLSRGLVAAINPAARTGAQSLIGAPSFAVRSRGIAVVSPSSSVANGITQPTPAFGSAATIIFLGTLTTDATVAGVIGGIGTSGAGDQIFAIQCRRTGSTDARAIIKATNGGGLSSAEIPGWNADWSITPSVWAATYAGTSASLTIYRNGIDVTSSRLNTAASGAMSSMDNFSIGTVNRGTDFVVLLGQSCLVGAAFNVALAPAEISELAAEIWSLYEPQRIFIPVAAAGGALPTLSLPTYMPGSLSSVGFRPRVTAS